MTREGLIGVNEWLGTARGGRLRFLINPTATETQRQNTLDAVQRLRYRVASALEDFKNDKRCAVPSDLFHVFPPEFNEGEQAKSPRSISASFREV